MPNYKMQPSNEINQIVLAHLVDDIDETHEPWRAVAQPEWAYGQP